MPPPMPVCAASMPLRLDPWFAIFDYMSYLRFIFLSAFCPFLLVFYVRLHTRIHTCLYVRESSATRDITDTMNGSAPETRLL